MQGGMLILLMIPIAHHTERYRQSGKVGKTRTTAMFELPESRVQDIDNESDWRLAELKFQLLEGGR